MPEARFEAEAGLQALAAATGVTIGTCANGVRVTLREPELAFEHSFVSGTLARRARQSKQALLRACNNKQRGIRRVLDLTAGWGADALALARHGQQVTLVEHNPLLASILEYSHALLAAIETESEVARRIAIRHANAAALLAVPGAASDFDCIYLDPMFPAHKSGARPAKEMQILQAITANADIERCFELALAKALKRVVVKRPAKAPALTGQQPDLVYREKTIRFDVYLT